MNVKTRFFASALVVLMTAALLVPAASAEEAVSRPTLTIGRFDTPPTIDGKFSESEWGGKSFTLAEGQPGVTVHRDKTTDGGGNEIEKPIESTATDVYMGMTIPMSIFVWWQSIKTTKRWRCWEANCGKRIVSRRKLQPRRTALIITTSILASMRILTVPWVMSGTATVLQRRS